MSGKLPVSEYNELFDALSSRRPESAREVLTLSSADGDDSASCDEDEVTFEEVDLIGPLRELITQRWTYMDSKHKIVPLEKTGLVYDPLVHMFSTEPWVVELPHSIVTEMMGCVVLRRTTKEYWKSSIGFGLRSLHLVAACLGWFTLVVQGYLSWYVHLLETEDPRCQEGDRFIRVLCMALWAMTMLTNMYQNVVSFRYISEIPTWHPRMQEILDEVDGFCQLLYRHVKLPAYFEEEMPPITIRIPVTGITHLQRFYMTCCVTAEILTKVVLVWFGLGFIAKTHGDAEKVLNTIGLAFIAEIDDIALSLLLSRRCQDNTAAIFPPLHFSDHYEDHIGGKLSSLDKIMVSTRPLYSVVIFSFLIFASLAHFCDEDGLTYGID